MFFLKRFIPYTYRFFLLANILALLTLINSASAQTTTGTTPDGFVYSVSNSQITITGYVATGSIPRSITVSGSSLPVTSIAADAFLDSVNLVSVTIPDSVTSIGADALSGINMTTITVDPANLNYSSSNGVLFSKDKTQLLQYPEAKLDSSYTVPNTVTTIGYDAFYYCLNLTSVTIPSSVTTLGDYAFNLSSNLTNITLTNGLTNIGQYTFQYCTLLTNITLPATVDNIGDGAFQYCSPSLIVDFLGNSPTTMGSSVFDSTATLYYFHGSTGFTSPTWLGYHSVDIGSYTPLTPWLLSNGFSYNTSLLSTPNHDGVTLLMDYALHLNPNINQSHNLPKPTISGGLLSLTYYSGSPGITYSPEVSNNLQTWTTSGITVSGPDIYGFSTATVPLSGGKYFMRLKIISP